jgi:hypothetical protein
VLASAVAISLSILNLLALALLAWRLTHQPRSLAQGVSSRQMPTAGESEPEQGPVGPTELGEPPEL